MYDVYSSMQQLLGISSLLMLLILGPVQVGISQHRIIIDEDFNDWFGRLSTYSDGLDRPSGIDLLEMQVANDAEYLYVTFSLNMEIALGNSLVNHSLWLSIDTDNDPTTGFPEQAGYGTELAINFNGHYAWFNVPDPDVRVTFGDLGLQVAPTYTSSTFELAIPRAVKPDGIHHLFMGDTIKLVINDDLGNDRMPNTGTTFTYVFAPTPADSSNDVELAKADPAYIRAIAYYVLLDNAWEPAGLSRLERMVKALDGDLFCFQESGATSAQVAKGHMDAWLPLTNGAGWYVYKDGGRLTCSKWPINQTWNLLRKTAMLIDLPQPYPQDLLLINAHLSCCSQNQGRQEQVDEFAAFILDAKSPGGSIDLPPLTPIIFLGDMNLVGYRQQLETILTGNIQDKMTYGQGGPLDWDSSDLADAVPLHLDSNLVFTWRDLQGDGFPPGRLDYHIYTDAILDKKRAFVLQTETMDMDVLARYHLQPSDTEISDHLPLVVDYAITSTLTPVEHSQPVIELKLYPNPVEEMLFIDTPALIKALTIRDVWGRSVWVRQKGPQELDMSHVAPGIYWVQITLEGYDQIMTHIIEVK